MGFIGLYIQENYVEDKNWNFFFMSEIFGYMFVNLEKKRRLFDIVKRLREIKKNFRNLFYYI